MIATLGGPVVGSDAGRDAVDMMATLGGPDVVDAVEVNEGSGVGDHNS
jgi:hypothetical protein